ncbi:MAG: response regulator [Moraxellaceae bacterium]|jgi:sigma-B regulation protein RsbU (phosphoserine phosphatase)|nr:response regulator [Moraxellaceae bacterium]MBP9730988.1 response regulator [Moraxellaceae bacterium]MCC6201364.1 response regulator [Moraxellaceae bacterium]HQV42266.1 response regulator [Moraxellaceae bacterium]HQX89778.1 response regulator [Moraxellaceae bacterium]
MPNTDTSILVVDDTKFSSAMVNRVIARAGYLNVRHANSAATALKLLEERPAHILIADWLMPEMDGLELSQRVRQLDESCNHFTYVMLLTAKEGVEALAVAFEQGVDDFVNKSNMQDQLLPRLLSAERITNLQNRLLQENQNLIEANAKLKKLSPFDGLTGLGNRAYAARRLADTIKHVSSRGGAACCLLLTISNFDAIRKQYPPAIVSQMLLAVARRLRQLVRPLDVVTRIGPNQFAIITHQPDITHCTEHSYRRIFDGVNLKAIKTGAGFVSIKAAMTIAACDEDALAPSPEALMELAQAQVGKAIETSSVITIRWTGEAQTA